MLPKIKLRMRGRRGPVEERDTIASARHGSLGPKRTRAVRSLSGHLCQVKKVRS